MELGYEIFCNIHTQYWPQNTFSRIVFLKTFCHLLVGDKKGEGVWSITDKEGWGMESAWGFGNIWFFGGVIFECPLIFLSVGYVSYELVQTHFYWNKKFRINTSTVYTELAHWFLVWGLKKLPWLAPEKILETVVPLDCRKLIPEFLFFKGKTTRHILSYIFKS